jgi:hypothetical protein
MLQLEDSFDFCARFVLSHPDDRGGIDRPVFSQTDRDGGK